MELTKTRKPIRDYPLKFLSRIVRDLQVGNQTKLYADDINAVTESLGYGLKLRTSLW